MTSSVVAWARRALLAPCAASALLLALASAIPVRLDLRNFQDLARAASLDVPRGRPTLYVSLDTDSAAYRFHGYALKTIAFPSKETLWLVPRSASARDRFADGVDERGRVFSPSGEEKPASELLGPYVRGGVVLYDNGDAQALMEARVPDLRRAAHAAVLADRPATFVRRRLESAFTPTRFARVAAFFGLPICLAGVLARRVPGPAAFFPGAALAILLAPASWTWLFSVSQLLPIAAPGPWPFAAWAASAAWLAVDLRSAGPPDATLRPSRRALVAGSLLLAAWSALYVARLDFDEDTQSHWLLMARSYAAHGRHVPQAVTHHVHAATYPYGYGSLLAFAGWLGGTPAADLFFPSEATSVAVLAYRIAVAAAHVAFLALVAWALAPNGRRATFAAACAAILPFAFPILQGRHVGAETLLLPILGGALVALESGTRLRSATLVAAGLVLAGTATLLKLEGALLAALVLVPWLAARVLLEGLPGARGLAASGAILVVAALPTLVWKLTLHVPNTAYEPFSMSVLAHRLGMLPPLWAAAFLALLHEGWLPILGIALPLVTLYRLDATRQFRARLAGLAVPAGVAAAALALPIAYVFSRMARLHQLDVSYTRLLLVPTFSAAFYVMTTARPTPGESA